MSTIPECFYRISIKALILNETRDKFLICQEEHGKWELPGGGLDWGETPQSDLPREIMEEMGLKTTWIAEQPSYFITYQMDMGSQPWAGAVIYETTLEHFDFTPSDECQAIGWIGKDNMADFDLFASQKLFVTQFDPKRHQ